MPPLPIGRGVCERDRRLLGEGERWDADRPGAELVGHAARAHERGDDGDRPVEGPDGLRDVPGDVGSLRRHRGDVDHDERVDLAGTSHDADRLRVLGPTGRGDHVDRVLRGRFGRERPGKRRRGRLREARDRESARLGCVGTLHREAARVRDDAYPVPGRGGLMREDGGDVEHLFQRVRPDHTVLQEQRVQGRVGRHDRGGVGCGCPGPRGTPAALHRDDRLASTDPARQTREALRIAEGLEVEQDDVGPRVVRPEAQDVVPGDVGLVAHRDELRSKLPT